MQAAIPLASEQPFSYVLNFSLTSQASDTKLLILDGDSEFDLLGITATTDQDGTLTGATGPTQLPENFSMLLTNVSSGRQFSSAALNRGNICGNAFTNFVREGKVIRFPRKQQLQIQVTNLVALTIAVQIALKGYKVFNRLPG